MLFLYFQDCSPRSLEENMPTHLSRFFSGIEKDSDNSTLTFDSEIRHEMVANDNRRPSDATTTSTLSTDDGLTEEFRKIVEESDLIKEMLLSSKCCTSVQTAGEKREAQDMKQQQQQKHKQKEKQRQKQQQQQQLGTEKVSLFSMKETETNLRRTIS